MEEIKSAVEEWMEAYERDIANGVVEVEPERLVGLARAVIIDRGYDKLYRALNKQQ